MALFCSLSFLLFPFLLNQRLKFILLPLSFLFPIFGRCVLLLIMFGYPYHTIPYLANAVVVPLLDLLDFMDVCFHLFLSNTIWFG